MPTKKETTAQEAETKAPELDMEAIKKQIIDEAVSEAKAQAEAIVNQAKAQVAEMTVSEAKPYEETEEEKAYYNELVPVRLFKDGGKYKDDVTVIHNGKAWLIKRGVEVKVPRKIAEILNNSAIQIGVAAEVMEGFEETYEAGKSQLIE